MRSSRRNLGLQPELIPDDSDSNEDGSHHKSITEDIAREDIQSGNPDAEVQAVASSYDVNIEDSTFSKVTTDSESEDDERQAESQ